jgi:hypothetical protein
VRGSDSTDHVVFQLLSTTLPDASVEVTSKYFLGIILDKRMSFSGQEKSAFQKLKLTFWFC